MVSTTGILQRVALARHVRPGRRRSPDQPGSAHGGLLLWLLGDVVGVQSRAATALHKIEGEDTMVATLEFSNGALGIFHATTAAYPGYPRRIEITGTEGTIILETGSHSGGPLAQCPCRYRRKHCVGLKTRVASSAVVSDFRGHQALFEDFIRAIEQDIDPVCNGAKAGEVSRWSRQSIRLHAMQKVEGTSWRHTALVLSGRNKSTCGRPHP